MQTIGARRWARAFGVWITGFCWLLVGVRVPGAWAVEEPLWWRQRAVLSPSAEANDFAPANLGQLKQMAAMAAVELEATLEGGVGESIRELIRQWSEAPGQANDFAVANLGQLKAVASLFHQRLEREGFVWIPWRRPFLQGPSNDFAPANLGQLKALFAFDLSADFDGDGLPDWWELRKLSVFEASNAGGADHGSSVALFDGESDPDGDGVSNAAERVNGSDPADFYNGQEPVLRVLGGDGQLRPRWGSEGMELAVSVSDATGQPLVNAPIRFWVNGGDIVLGGEAAWSDWLPEVRSGADGCVRVPVRLGDVGGSVTVSAVRAPGLSRQPTPGSRPQLIRVHGRPGRERLQEPEVSSGPSATRIGVRYTDWEGAIALAARGVQARVTTGDVRLEGEGQDGIFFAETDSLGWACFVVQPGRLLSEVVLEMEGWTESFWIEPAKSGLFKVIGSSTENRLGVCPGDGVPVLWLNAPLPESALDAEGNLGSAGAPGLQPLCMQVEVPVSRASDGSVTVRREKQPVPGVWRVLPGAAALAFIPERPLWEYKTWAPPNPLRLERWLQGNLRFEVRWEVGGVPWGLAEPYESSFSLKDSDAFTRRLAEEPSAERRLQMQLDRTADSFVLEPRFGVDWTLPESESEGVDRSVPIWLGLSQAVDGASLRACQATLVSSAGSLGCRLEFDCSKLRLQVVPDCPLEWATAYQLTGLEELRSFSGVRLSEFKGLGFRTRAAAALPGAEAVWNPGQGSKSSDLWVILPDASVVIRGEGAAWDWTAVEAKWASELDGSVEVPVRVGVNSVTRKVVVSPEQRLEPGVVYRLQLSVPAAAGEAGKEVGSRVTREYRIRAEDRGFRESLGARSASDYGSGPGKAPLREVGSDSASGDGSEAGTFRFAFWAGAGVSPSGDRSPSALEIVSCDLRGVETSQTFAVPFLEGGGAPAEAVSQPIPLGSVIRFRGVGDGPVSGGQAPLVSVGRVSRARSQAMGVKLPATNFQYVCFEQHMLPEGESCRISPMDGLDPGYPKWGTKALLHRLGTARIHGACREMRWCPVIVRNELDSPERSAEELVLSTLQADSRLAPLRGSSGMLELPDVYKKRLAKYYSAPFPARSMAWISVFGDDSPGSDRAFFADPAMPHLTVSIRDAPEGILGCWRLRVFYDRGNGRGLRASEDPGRLHPTTQPQDFVDIPGRPMPDVFPCDAPLRAANMPKPGSAAEACLLGNVPGYTDWMSASAEWRIFETAEWRREIESRGFFGGEAVLYWAPKIQGSEGSRPGEFEVARFRIGGRNPSNGVARFWLEGRDGSGRENVEGAGKSAEGLDGPMWYAYAIAKHETGEYRYAPPGSSRASAGMYNQFRCNPGRPDCGFPAWNNDGQGKPGGYGIFQVTGNVQEEKADIPRHQIWNWQENMRAGGDILRSKWRGAVRSLAVSKRQAGGAAIPSLNIRGVRFQENTTHTILDAITMKRFNGASRPNPVDKIDLGENGSGFFQGFAVTHPENGDYAYRSESRGLWCLCRFNSVVRVVELADGTKKRFYEGFDYVARVCAEVEALVLSAGGVVER